jgi:hypothetical protein
LPYGYASPYSSPYHTPYASPYRLPVPLPGETYIRPEEYVPKSAFLLLLLCLTWVLISILRLPDAPSVCDLLAVHQYPHAAYAQPTRQVDWDIRFPPNFATVLSNFTTRTRLAPHEGQAPAVLPHTDKIKLISRAFPWEFDIAASVSVRDGGVGVTVEDVLAGLYEGLHKHLTSPEFWIVEDESRDRVAQAYKYNISTRELKRSDKDGVRRIDWLSDLVAFRGLTRDDEFVKKRVFDKSAYGDTWVVVFGGESLSP